MPTVSPFLSTPLPSTAIACWTGEGLSIVMVTLPALALSDDLSNLSWPLESAATWRLVDAPPPPLDGAGAGVEEAPVSVEALVSDLLSLPQPATASVARAEQSRAEGVVSFIRS